MFNKAWQLSVLPQNDRGCLTDIGHVFYIRHRVKILYTRDLDLPPTTWLDFIFFDHSKSENHCIWTDTQFPSDEALTLLTDPVASPCCVTHTHSHCVWALFLFPPLWLDNYCLYSLLQPQWTSSFGGQKIDINLLQSCVSILCNLNNRFEIFINYDFLTNFFSWSTRIKTKGACS